jgi:hypothetical protein
MAHPHTLTSLGRIHGTSFLVVHNLGYIMYLAAALCRDHRELKCNIHWFEMLELELELSLSFDAQIH